MKYTHVAHNAIVKRVRGIAMAARSQALLESLMWPASLVSTNWVEKKFFLLLVYNLQRRIIELTATIVVGRYIRVMTVKILTAAASFVLLSVK